MGQKVLGAIVLLVAALLALVLVGSLIISADAAAAEPALVQKVENGVAVTRGMPKQRTTVVEPEPETTVVLDRSYDGVTFGGRSVGDESLRPRHDNYGWHPILIVPGRPHSHYAPPPDIPEPMLRNW